MPWSCRCRPLLSKKLHEWNPIDHPSPACNPAVWQCEPFRIAFQPAGSPPVNFDLVGLSAVLVEEGDAGEAGDSAH